MTWFASARTERGAGAKGTPAGVRRRAAAVLAVVVLLAGLSACAADEAAGELAVVHVPADATLDEAGARVADGGIVLIAPGTHHGTLDIRADDVTVRGAHRERVVLDGQLSANHGVIASGARVAVENLTVQNYLQNGVLVTGMTDDDGAGVARGPDGYVPGEVPEPVPGYLVQQVTAINNGLYGIYVFNRTGGLIRDNLASGGSDSGIYVGQCASCHSWVTGNTVTHNAVGIELANASAVTVTGNRVVDNRLGISVLSNYLEAHGPSTSVTIAGNLIADNAEAATPTQASGAFGVGIGLAGAVDPVVVANRISGHSNVGVWVTSSEDFAPIGARIESNAWYDNGLDMVFTTSHHVQPGEQCFLDAPDLVTEPAGLGIEGCGAVPAVGSYAQPTAPTGVRFSDVEPPTPQPGFSDVDETPRRVPDAVEIPDVFDQEPPSEDFLP